MKYIILLLLVTKVHTQTLNLSINDTLLEKVILYEIDTNVVQDTGVIIYGVEKGVGLYVEKVFILKNGSYIKIAPFYIKYVIINNDTKKRRKTR